MSVARDYLGIEEDDDPVELLFEEVDPAHVMLFGLLLGTLTAASSSMLILIYVFKQELVRAGGFPPVMSLARVGMFGAFLCFIFAFCTLVYRFNNGMEGDS
jgi:hypothetical protein